MVGPILAGFYAVALEALILIASFDDPRAAVSNAAVISLLGIATGSTADTLGPLESQNATRIRASLAAFLLCGLVLAAAVVIISKRSFADPLATSAKYSSGLLPWEYWCVAIAWVLTSLTRTWRRLAVGIL